MEKDKNLFTLITSAIIVEAIITYFKEFFIGGDFSFSMLFSIILGIIIALAYKLDILEHFKMESEIPFLGQALTGVLISRGANYTYDLLSKITSQKI